MQESQISMLMNIGQIKNIQHNFKDLNPQPEKVTFDNEDKSVTEVSEYFKLTADQLINIIKESPEKTAQVLDSISGQITADYNVLHSFFDHTNIVKSSTRFNVEQREQLRTKLLGKIKNISINLENLFLGVQVAKGFLIKYNAYLNDNEKIRLSLTDDESITQELAELDEALSKVQSLGTNVEELKVRLKSTIDELQTPIQ